MKFLFPVVFLLTAVALFFGFIDPTYSEVRRLGLVEDDFNQALDRSKELQAIRDRLLSQYNTFPTEDLDRLSKLLPDTIDNVRLILDLDSMASTYNMRVNNVAITESKPQQGQTVVVGPDTKPFGSVVLSFSVAATYDNIIRFLRDLESSLRIVDVTSLAFGQPRGDLYEFKISIRTYWLK